MRALRLPLRPSLLALALLSSPLLSSPLAAQTPPQQLPNPPPLSADAKADEALPAPPPPQQTPVAPVAEEQRFVLQRVLFKGAAHVGQAELDALAADKIGQPVGLGDLQQIAQRVTALYQQRGYYLAQAVVPVQEVVNGTVEISVIEGLLGNVTIDVDPKAPITEERVRAVLADLKPGEPLHLRNYERAMLLLSDLPGLRVQSAIEEGTAAGTTDLVVQVTPGDRFTGSVELDNYGTKEVGRERLGGTVRWASPAGIGDNLDLRALVSSEGMWFGRLSYEAPLGARGLRLGAGASRVSYELAGVFEPLDAVGTADIYDLGLIYPLIRQRGHNLFVRAYGDQKDLTDEFRAVDFKADKRVNGFGLGWAWERRDRFGGGGYWSSSGALYLGHLKLLDEASRAVDQSIFGRHTAGSFTKLTIQVSRLQALMDRLSLFVGVGGQLADGNLDASEKLALGGYRAVRAYPSGEVLVDEGAIANVELRFAWTEQFTAFMFYDIGTGDLVRDPGPFDLDTDRTLKGPGLGLNYTRPGSFSANLTVAWQQSGEAVTDGGGHDPHVYFNLQKSF